MSNAAILDAAGAYLELEEWPGAKHNPEILGMFEAVGHGWVKDDETAWCAAFVGAVLGSLGLPHTGKLNARSYLDWGRDVPLREARPGDVVIFWRGHPDAATGHVAFLVGFSGAKVIVRGGNQGNKVSDAPYDVSRILGIRRADAALPETGRATVRAGDRGAMVLDLQDQLRRLGYFAGKMDGHFGPLTRGAVVAFQADHGLGADGVVGPKTWAAILDAEPRPERDVTEADLADSGTIKDARAVRAGAIGLGGAGIVTQALDGANAVGSQIAMAEGWLGTAKALVVEYWPVLIFVAGALALVWFADRIKARRVADARSGAHLGR